MMSRMNKLLCYGRHQLWVVAFSFLFLLAVYHHGSSNTKFSYNAHSEPECKPAMKVAFMKTHKCASSTIENILFRHAHRMGLNVAIPAKNNYLSRKDLFNRLTVTKGTPWGQLEMDVFTLHNRWNYVEVVGLMGRTVRTFTVVRQPVDLFESLYSYANLNKTFGLSLKEFVHTLRNETAWRKQPDNVVHKRRSGLLGRNQLAWDLGIHPAYYDNPHSEPIRKKIRQLDQQFELVMIAERMDESLILLADLLCWPIEWISHLDLNMRKPERKEADFRLDDDERQVLADFLRLDVAIYQYFNKRFEERLASYDSRRMAEQLNLLHQKNQELVDRCVINYVGNEKLHGKFKETSNAIMGYVINEAVPGCDLYAWSEPAFLSYFRKEMTKRVENEIRIDSSNQTLQTQKKKP